MSQLIALNPNMEPVPGYRLLEILGRGGFGEVWKATSPDGPLCALKFLRGSDSASIVREVKSITTVRQLEHPNLIRIDQVWGGHMGYIIVAMELADGSLLDLLEAHHLEFQQPIPADQVCVMLAQVAEALDFLNVRQHLVGGTRVAIQHCDVKPSNMLLVGENVKLADFGLSAVKTGRTQSHRRAGTLDYLAPEVFQGLLSDYSDQFSLAVSYYQLRVGKLPFPELRSFTEGEKRPAPDLKPLGVDERNVISRAMSHVPQNRYRDCREFVGQLTRVIS